MQTTNIDKNTKKEKHKREKEIKEKRNNFPCHPNK